jgi:hypothetical protein
MLSNDKRLPSFCSVFRILSKISTSGDVKQRCPARRERPPELIESEEEEQGSPVIDRGKHSDRDSSH